MGRIYVILLVFILLFAQVARASKISSIKKSNNIPQKICTLYFSGDVILKNIAFAESKADQTEGLSGVKLKKTGMLFWLKKSEPMVFWMRDTSTPLTVGFIDERGLVFQIEEMEQNSDTYHFSIKAAKAALELPKGGYQTNGLKIGTKLIKHDCF